MDASEVDASELDAASAEVVVSPPGRTLGVVKPAVVVSSTGLVEDVDSAIVADASVADSADVTDSAEVETSW